jgi:hypothetical protein
MSVQDEALGIVELTFIALCGRSLQTTAAR